MVNSTCTSESSIASNKLPKEGGRCNHVSFSSNIPVRVELNIWEHIQLTKLYKTYLCVSGEADFLLLFPIKLIHGLSTVETGAGKVSTGIPSFSETPSTAVKFSSAK